MNRLKNTKNYSMIIVLVLFISFIFNILLSMDNHNYKYKAGKEAYNNAVSIRNLNQINNELLKNALKLGSIENVDLLKLYMNYCSISDNISNLWYEYSYYSNEKALLDFSSNKSINENSIIASEIHGRIENYLKNMLDLEMNTQSYKVVLDSEELNKINVMYDVSNEIEEIYSSLIEGKLKKFDEEDLVKKIIRESYWVDILEEINRVNEKYIDVEFIFNKN